MKRYALFEKTVSALCYEFAARHLKETVPASEPPYNDITRFVLAQWRRMPRFLSAPLWLATIFFSFAALSRGSLFHRLPPERRGPVVDSWRCSRLRPFRDLMRFYGLLAVMALYSREGAVE